jgi:NADH-quinone oxidoreductase subunit L
MEGPTPVSALIHAATMVAAGVYMVARLFPLFSSVPIPLLVVAYLGLITAFISATIALVATDIKKVLAYSTISQLGFMMIGLGMAKDISAGTFHLTTHAFFKALLFLGAGSVIHAVHTQNIWEMGGLKKYMKITYITFIIASLSIAGIFPFSGFFSKDEILLVCYNSKNYFVFVTTLFCAFLTAFYMFRLCFIVFFGKTPDNLHPHESPPVMTFPLIILAIFSVISGIFGSPFMHHSFQKFITGEKEISHPNIYIMLASLIISILAILLSYLIYGKKIISLSFVRNKPWSYIYSILKNKYYIDEIYILILINPFLKISSYLSKFDLKIIDGIVNLFGFITVKLSLIYNLFDMYIVDGIVNLFGWLTKKFGEIFKFLQTGLLQNYILFLLGATILFLYIFK